MSKALQINNYIIKTPIIDILKQLKRELHNGKLKSIQVKGDDIRVTCPSHKNGLEDKPSCGIYIGEDTESVSYGEWNCFTCGAKGTFQHFVAECIGCLDKEAEKWLIARYGEEQESNSFLPDLEPINLTKKSTNTKYLDESVLDKFQSYHPYMDKRHLNKKVCETFKVKYDPKSECLVFPVWDDKGKLYMLTRRSVNNKQFIIDADKEKPIYLLNYIKEHNIKEATLVESQINCLTLWGWGIPSIASFGCKITSKQIDLINKSGINHLYIAYDPDEAGRGGILKCLKYIKKDIFVDVIEFPFGKDVNDLTEEEFDKLKIIDRETWLRVYGK